MNLALVLAGVAAAVISPILFLLLSGLLVFGLVVAAGVFPIIYGYAVARAVVKERDVSWWLGMCSLLAGGFAAAGGFYVVYMVWPEAVGGVATEGKEGVFVALVLMCSLLSTVVTSTAVGVILFLDGVRRRRTVC